MMCHVKRVVIGLILWSALIATHTEANERTPFLQGDDLNQAVQQVLAKAVKDCAPPMLVYHRSSVSQEPDAMCLARSVNVQATPDSVRQMTTTDLRHKMAVLGKECRGEGDVSRRQVVCEAQHILMVEHKKRIWAFGPIAENGGPQWKK